MKIIEKYITKCPCWTNNINAKALYDSNTDKRYWVFQCHGPSGLMLHSVGCAQPSADVFADRWNRADNNNVAVHAVIDATTGVIDQCLKWNYRGWHGGRSSNDTHIGVEMGESSAIRYLKKGEAGYAPGKFEIKDRAKAEQHCRTAYNAAVELFAYLCQKFHLDPLTAICSHREGYSKGIASNHGDPEHYWKGLSMPYTMNGFRNDVKAKLDEMNAPTPEPTPAPEPSDKTIEELAREVINGKWGSGQTRKDRLTAAGYDYYAVQRCVDEIMAESKCPLKDMTKGSEVSRSVGMLYKLGITKGTGATTYSPERNITRGEAAIMLYRLYKALKK